MVNPTLALIRLKIIAKNKVFVWSVQHLRVLTQLKAWGFFYFVFGDKDTSEG